jgi:hypothetical protein
MKAKGHGIFRDLKTLDLQTLRLFLLQLGLHAEGGVGDGTQTLLTDELSRLTADAVGLVLYTYQGCLQVLNELQLTLCQPSCFFL